MCVVSMVGDHYGDKWEKWKPMIPTTSPTTNPLDPLSPIQWPTTPTREEFDQLKKEVEDLKALLKRAKEYDEKNNEPSCEMKDKMKFLKEVAKLVGVDLDEVLKNGGKI